MTLPVLEVTVDQVAIGCDACGYAIKGRPSEVELLVSVMPAHVGSLLLASRMSVDGGPFAWVGDGALIRSVTDAPR